MRLLALGRLAISACGLLLLTCFLQSPASDPDVNGDGVVDIADVSLVNGCISDPLRPECVAADVSGDGSVTAVDLNIVIAAFRRALQPPAVACDPDVDNDGVVTIQDVLIVNGCITKPVRPQCDVADLNGDGSVTSADLTLVVEDFGELFAVPDIEEAKRSFCELHDVAAADDQLAQFLASPTAQCNPQSFQSARFLRAVTRVLRPFAEASDDGTPESIDSVPEALDAAGFGAAGRNPLDWTASPPVDELGQCFVPDGGGRFEQVEGALRGALVPAITASLADLESVTSGWEDACLYRVVHRHDDGSTSEIVANIELDFADALFLESALQAARSALYFLSAYETDVDLHEAVCEIAPLHRTLQSFLEDPAFDGFLRLADDTSALPLASQDLQDALATAPRVLDALLAESDDPLDDLVSLDPVTFTPEREALLRAQLAAAGTAFDEPSVIPGARICGDGKVDLGQSFAGLELRGLLPPFVGNLADLLSLPDATLGGMLPGGSVDAVRCTADTDGPALVESPEFLVTSPHPLLLQLADPDVGANPGHAVDPASLGVMMEIFSLSGPGIQDCSATLDGSLACSEGAACDVTSLLTKDPNADGSLAVSGELAVSSSGQLRCGVSLTADTADVVGNQGTDFRFLEVVTAGAFARFDPPGGVVLSPFALSIPISAPFGDVDPGDHVIDLLVSGCGEIRINGTLVPESDLGDTFFEDVTELFALAPAGPTSVTRSGTVAVSNACDLQFSVRVSDQPISDSVFYLVEVTP